MRSNHPIARVMLAAAALAAWPAGAAMVSVSGGFTSFNSSAVFGFPGFQWTELNGQVICPDAGCNTGLGPANVSFAQPLAGVTFQNFLQGTGDPLNNVSFTPASPQLVTATGAANPFLLGTLSFTNGIASNTSFGFTLTTHTAGGSPDCLTVPGVDAFDCQTLVDTLFMQVTPNDFLTKTPMQNADFVYFSGAPLIGSARAYELSDTPTGTNTVSVDVWGYINSLHLSAFTKPSGGFFDPGIAIDPTPTNMPEPATLALLSAALCTVGLARRRGAAARPPR